MKILFNILKLFKIRHKIWLIFYTLTLSFLLSLLFHSKFTNSFELDSSDSFDLFTNLFVRPQSPALLTASTSPILKKKHGCNVGCTTIIVIAVILISFCLTYIIHELICKEKRLNIFKQRKLKDVESGRDSFEEWEKEIKLERQQIINEKKKKRMLYIQNQLPTIYEEYETVASLL
ncbi:hypothetical protein C1645_747650 [Glomus cerebriforme]|uniref:Transmembrane protein n=1 Tax=Glomus cerebriforme TaxID=658196 RepID=A0A397TLZ1_9GLOM|nr:hypothetical protein C1645_747650 [Glomus cerebriforme]